MGNKKRKPIVKENSFEAGVSGHSGTLAYGNTYGTPSGGNITQNPSKFSSSSKTTSNFVPNTSKGSSGDSTEDELIRKGQFKTGFPDGQIVSDPKNTNNRDGDTEKKDGGLSTQIQPNQSLDPEKQYDPQVDKLFQKKDTPSPDEVMSALQYELSQMVKKDKHIAKQVVLKNMKQDPHYYSMLNMLNIDDEKMKVNESQTKLVDESTFSKTKALLDSMVEEKRKNRPVATSPEINKIFKDLTDKRMSRRIGNQG